MEFFFHKKIFVCFSKKVFIVTLLRQLPLRGKEKEIGAFILVACNFSIHDCCDHWYTTNLVEFDYP